MSKKTNELSELSELSVAKLVELNIAGAITAIEFGEEMSRRVDAAKSSGSQKISVRANPDIDKRTISVYGFGRMPVTLYRAGWERMAREGLPAILAFIEEHSEYLPNDKATTCKAVPTSLVGDGKPFRTPVAV